MASGSGEWGRFRGRLRPDTQIHIAGQAADAPLIRTGQRNRVRTSASCARQGLAAADFNKTQDGFWIGVGAIIQVTAGDRDRLIVDGRAGQAGILEFPWSIDGSPLALPAAGPQGLAPSITATTRSPRSTWCCPGPAAIPMG